MSNFNGIFPSLFLLVMHFMLEKESIIKKNHLQSMRKVEEIIRNRIAAKPEIYYL